MTISRQLSIVLQCSKDVIFSTLPELFVRYPSEVKTQLLRFGRWLCEFIEKLCLLRLWPFDPLQSSLGDSILDLLFDFEERPGLAGEFHLFENSVHELTKNSRLKTGSKFAA